MWNFPHTIGALDGKHIKCKKPPGSGSTYCNYKKFFSIVLFALVDSDYKFVWVDLGGRGAVGNAQIWNESDLKEALVADRLNHCSLLIFVLQVTTFLAFLLAATGHWFTGWDSVSPSISPSPLARGSVRESTLSRSSASLSGGGSMETSCSLSDFGGEGRRLVALRPRGRWPCPWPWIPLAY